MPAFFYLRPRSIKISRRIIGEDSEYDEIIDTYGGDEGKQAELAAALSIGDPKELKAELNRILKGSPQLDTQVGEISYKKMGEELSSDEDGPVQISLYLDGELLITQKSFGELQTNWGTRGYEIRPPVYKQYTLEDPSGRADRETVSVNFYLNWDDLFKELGPVPSSIADDRRKVEAWNRRREKVKLFIEKYGYNRLLKMPRLEMDDKTGKPTVKFVEWMPSSDDLHQPIRNVPVEDDTGDVVLKNVVPHTSADYNRAMFAKLRRLVPQARRPKIFGGLRKSGEAGSIKDLNERFPQLPDYVIKSREDEILEELDAIFASIPANWREVLLGGMPPDCDNVYVYPSEKSLHFNKPDGHIDTFDKAAINKLKRLQAAMLSREKSLAAYGDEPAYKHYWGRTISDPQSYADKSDPLEVPHEYGQPYGHITCPECGKEFDEVVVIDNIEDDEGYTSGVKAQPIECVKCGNVIEIDPSNFDRVESTKRDEYEAQMRGISDQINFLSRKSIESQRGLRTVYFSAHIDMDEFWEELENNIKGSGAKPDEDVNGLVNIHTTLTGWHEAMNKLDPVRTRIRQREIDPDAPDPYGLKTSYKLGIPDEYLDRPETYGAHKFIATQGLLGFSRDFNKILAAVVSSALGVRATNAVLVGDGTIVFRDPTAKEDDREAFERSKLPYDPGTAPDRAMFDAIDALEGQGRNATMDAVEAVAKYKTSEALEAMKKAIGPVGYEQRDMAVAEFLEQKVEELEKYLDRYEGSLNIDDRLEQIKSQGHDVSMDAVDAVSAISSERVLKALIGAMEIGQNDANVAKRIAEVIGPMGVREFREETKDITRGHMTIGDLVSMNDHANNLIKVLRAQRQFATADVVKELRQIAVNSIYPIPTTVGLETAIGILSSLRSAYEYGPNDREVAAGMAEEGEFKQENNEVSKLIYAVVDGLNDSISRAAEYVKTKEVEEKKEKAVEIAGEERTIINDLSPNELDDFIEAGSIGMEEVENTINGILSTQGQDVTMDTVKKAAVLLKHGDFSRNFTNTLVSAYENGQNDSDVFVALSELVNSMEQKRHDYDDEAEDDYDDEADWGRAAEWEEEYGED